ncbi:MAG: DUF5666 domain-containing protein [Planctomycetes bacterium]|nr:DUF5666 domain-containing protein [Planctomycetota bacterium]
MKWFTTLAAVLAMAFLATSMTMANEGKEHEKDKKEKPAAAAHGTLVSASDTQIVVNNKKDGDVTVKIDAATTIKIDGKPAKAADLKPGMKVTASALENGVSKHINASTEHEHGKGKEKDKSTGKPS